MNHLVVAPVLLPLFAGILLILLRSTELSIRRGLSLAASVCQIGLAVALAEATRGGEILVYSLGNWPAPFGIVLVADRLAAWMLLTTAILALPALWYATRGAPDTVSRDGQHFHALFQFELCGLSGAFLTGDLFNLFVFFEVLLIASYGLMLHGGGRLRTRASLHYIVVNLVGSTLFLIAVGTLFGTLGTLNLADIAVRVAAAPPDSQGTIRAAALLLFAVFALKAALTPLHLWLPAAYAETGAAVAALFAVMTKVGAYCILRVYALAFGPHAGPRDDLLAGWLLPVALVTLTVGMLGVMGADRLRRQIAFLVVASVGTLVAAIALGGSDGIGAGLYYLPVSTFAAGALFLLADPIASQRGALADRLEPGPVLGHHWLLGGLFFALATLALGLPPLAGFVGKFLFLRAAVDHPGALWIFAATLGGGLLGLMALARSGSTLFFRATEHGVDRESANLAARQPGAGELAAVGALLAVAVAMTIWAGPLAGHTRSIGEQISDPQLYIRAVLGASARS